MLAGPVTTVLRAILLAAPVFAANATDWSSRSIYQVACHCSQPFMCLTEARSSSQIDSPPLMTQRCPVTQVLASIVAAHGAAL
jgi:hypothetical protein